MREITAKESVILAKENRCQGMAYTYNEPTIWHEYCYDSAKLAKKAGLYTVYVSNGYISKEALEEISSVLDAINVDIKAFKESFYKNICKARLEPVLDTCILAKELGIHLELTYLIIPDYNDSTNEIRDFCRWVTKNLGNEVPVHFSRFHPDFNFDNVKRTPMDKMLSVYDIAKEEGILYPYLGNVSHGSYENTICPSCGATCVERYAYTVKLDEFENGKCMKCGYKLPFILSSFHNE
jgi:pyruvate formate lyase activating enzyme